MKKLIKQTLAYSLVFGIIALIAPVTVAAKSVKSLNLYGIDTSRMAATTAIGLSNAQVGVIALSVFIGIVLIANGKNLKRLLNN